MRYLVMWSGGVDSTYALAWLLANTDHQIHAHHVHINNWENRSEAEHRAIKALLPRLNAIRPFTHSFTGHDNGEILYIPYDMAIVCFHAGLVIREFNGKKAPFDAWTIGTHKAEGHWGARWNDIEPAVKAAAFHSIHKHLPEFELPILVEKKDEIIFLKAKGLYEYCFYCRAPKNGQSCGSCKACGEVERALT